MRRVVASSDSRSGNRSASGLGCLVDLLDPLAAFLADFFVDFLADFFVDLRDFFDLLEDLERADVLAMNGLQGRGSSII
jgi:hypothetical protein